MQYLGTLIPLFQKGYIIQTENQPGNTGFEQYCRPKGPNGHIHRTSEYTFFSSMHGTLYTGDHMFTKQVSKFEKTEVIPSIFVDHNGMKLKNQ